MYREQGQESPDSTSSPYISLRAMPTTEHLVTLRYPVPREERGLGVYDTSRGGKGGGTLDGGSRLQNEPFRIVSYGKRWREKLSL